MSEYVRFAAMMVLFVAILTGSYRFVLSTASGREEQRRAEREREAG